MRIEPRGKLAHLGHIAAPVAPETLVRDGVSGGISQAEAQ